MGLEKYVRGMIKGVIRFAMAVEKKIRQLICLLVRKFIYDDPATKKAYIREFIDDYEDKWYDV